MAKNKIKILDAEGDEMTCTTQSDECIHINTEKYSYVIFTEENLYQMLKLIDKNRTY